MRIPNRQCRPKPNQLRRVQPQHILRRPCLLPLLTQQNQRPDPWRKLQHNQRRSLQPSHRSNPAMWHQVNRSIICPSLIPQKQLQFQPQS